MPYRKRLRIEPTHDWSQLRLQLAWPEQVRYELIRPVVLFGFSPAERAKQTGVPERTLRRKADRFDAEGLASVFQPARPATPRAVPPAMRRAIAELKAELELSRARGVLDSVSAARPATPADDANTAGLTPREIEVLRLVAEGLNNQAIGERLFVSEHTVHRHVANIFSKLSVSSRAAAVAQAARRNLLA